MIVSIILLSKSHRTKQIVYTILYKQLIPQEDSKFS